MAEAPKAIVVAPVERIGDAIIVPKRIALPDAVSILQAKIAEEEQLMNFHETITVFPWEGAKAFKKAITEKLGFATDYTDSWTKPGSIAIEVGFGRTEQIPWGVYMLTAGNNDLLACDSAVIEGRVVFQISGQFRRKFEGLVREIAARTKELALAESIYRGQALQIVFRYEDGDKIQVPTPKFLDLRQVNLMELIYSDDLQRAIETNIFTPIRYSQRAGQIGVPLKRGVLLAGDYGTGKTLCAYATAKVAVENGWTFIYVKNAGELAEAIKFAQAYSPAVVFAEDIDREAAGIRDDSVNEIINTLDGIDTKGNDVMVILTTNHLSEINAAMLRPGRLDVILEVVPPDAKACERLVQLYGRGFLSIDTDLTAVGKELAGHIPAVVREVVERAKLEWLRRTNGSQDQISMIGEDLEYAARTVIAQRKLTDKKPVAAVKHRLSEMMVEVEGHTNGNGHGVVSRV